MESSRGHGEAAKRKGGYATKSPSKANSLINTPHLRGSEKRFITNIQTSQANLFAPS